MGTRFMAGTISGEITAPPSKSSMQRAVVAALLAGGRSVLLNPSMSDDSVAALGVAGLLGASVDANPSRVEITGGGEPADGVLDCGESGLGVRLFSAVAATTGKKITLTGRGSLLKRPMTMVEQPLRDLGARVTSTGGFLPLTIEGPLTGGLVSVDGSKSSQFLSGLLFALPLAENDSIIEVANLNSKPYIDLTTDVLTKFGIEVINEDYLRFLIRGGQKYSPAEYKVEGDWSGAAFLLVMGAIGGSITVKGLESGSSQADRVITDVLRLAGADVTQEADRVHVNGGNLRPFSFDLTDCPDLAPPLAVLAAACIGRSVLYGTERLNIKESSRGANLAESFNKLGASVTDYGSRIEIVGTGALRHAVTSSFGDHRMAMAMAAASVLSADGIEVDDTECINKSYPGFVDDFIRAGGRIAGTK